MSNWTFFTNYGHILFLLAQNSKMTVRDISLRVGITERATQRIIAEFVKDGYLEVTKIGRQNTYKVLLDKHLKHDLEMGCKIGDFVEVIKNSKNHLNS